MTRLRVALVLGLLGGCTDASPDAEAKGPPSTESERNIPPGAKGQVFEATVFAGGFDLSSLPASIGIATLGGAHAVLLPRGSKLPTERTEVFTTALDGQTNIEIALAMGERPLSADNRQITQLSLEGIPARPRGVPQIEVTYAVDEKGLLRVHAQKSRSRRSTTC